MENLKNVSKETCLKTVLEEKTIMIIKHGSVNYEETVSFVL